jgi:hypothetical protein
MALVKPSPLIGAISGSIGSTTFRSTRQGLVAAARQGKRLRQNHNLLNVRAALAQLHEAWLSTTNENRRSFWTASRNVSWPNRLGVPSHPSAYNLYTCINLTRSPTPLIAPAVPWLSTSGRVTPPPTSYSVQCSYSTGVLVTADNPAVNLAYVYQILYGASNLPPGAWYRPKRWTRIGIKYACQVTTDWSAEAGATFGIHQLGERVAFRLIWLIPAWVPSAPVWTTLVLGP